MYPDRSSGRNRRRSQWLTTRDADELTAGRGHASGDSSNDRWAPAPLERSCGVKDQQTPGAEIDPKLHNKSSFRSSGIRHRGASKVANCLEYSSPSVFTLKEHGYYICPGGNPWRELQFLFFWPCCR